MRTFYKSRTVEFRQTIVGNRGALGFLSSLFLLACSVLITLHLDPLSKLSGLRNNAVTILLLVLEKFGKVGFPSFIVAALQ